MEAPDVKVETDIEAGSDDVWKIISEYETWDDWHKTGVEIETEGEQPKKLKFYVGPVRLGINLSKLRISEGKSIEWTGALPFSRPLLYGERKLAVVSISNGTCRLIQTESFFGLLSPLLRKKLSALYERNYSMLNENIRSIAESQSRQAMHATRA